MRTAKRRDEILEYIKEHANCTLSDVVCGVCIGYNYASALTKQLCEEGFVESARDKYTNMKHFKFINKSVWRP